MSKESRKGSEKKSGRRRLLKGALVVLGASTLIQVSGGVPSLYAVDAHKNKVETQSTVKGNKSTAYKTDARKDKWSKTTYKANVMDKRKDKISTTQAPVKGTGQPQ